MIADLVVIAITLIFAIGGFTHGFISSVASFLGFLVGLLVGVRVAVAVGDRIDTASTRITVTLLVIIALGALGQFVFTSVAHRIRKRLTWSPARQVDRVLGGVVSAVAALLVCWMLAVPLAGSALPQVAAEVKQSRLVRAVDAAVPSGLQGLYSSLQELLAEQGLPDVVAPLNPTTATPVGPPESGIAATQPIRQARASIVKVEGIAESCSKVVDGSGFVIAPNRVMTNAHVVAGTSSLEVQSTKGTVKAVVVYVDEDVDIAVLRTDGLSAPALSFAGDPLSSGADVVVAGFPGGGDYRAEAARVRTRGEVSGPNFRDTATVSREVYSLRAEVIPGNSGGPLLDPDGKVVGVVFASSVDKPDVGYALTNAEVAEAVTKGTAAADAVSTGSCS